MSGPKRSASPFHHRPAGRDDAEALYGLAERCFAQWGGYGRTIITWSTLEGVQTWLVDEADGGLIGFIMFAQIQSAPESVPSTEILAIAAHPAARGRGIGAYLLQSALSEIRRWQGVGESVWLTVATDNVAGQRLFGGAGFRTREGPSAAYPNGVESSRMAFPLGTGATPEINPPLVRIWAETALR